MFSYSLQACILPEDLLWQIPSGKRGASRMAISPSSVLLAVAMVGCILLRNAMSLRFVLLALSFESSAWPVAVFTFLVSRGA